MIDKLYSQFLQSKHVSIDTRTLKGGEIFFCLNGENFNANKFAKEALDKGAAYVVMDDQTYYEKDHPKLLLVDDSLKTLQELAVYHRKQFNIPIIGITGSNGKTTTKELVATVLKSQFNIFATKGNYNNHIGVPLSLLEINEHHDLAVIEMGANHVGEIAELCMLSQPTLGIITNIGQAHLEGFGSYENIKQTKLALFESIKQKDGLVFVHYDDEVLMKESTGFKRVTYGLNDLAEVYVSILKGETNLTFTYQNQLVKTQLFGEFNIFNAAAAIAIGKYFKISNDKILHAIENYHPSNNRSQIELGPNNLLILDAYNANPDSMSHAIDFFGKVKAASKSLILGDMLELGEFEESKHIEILKLIQKYDFNHVFLVGPAFNKLRNSLPQAHFFMSSDEALEHFTHYPIRKNQILLKGSRGIKLEKLKEILL